MPKKYQYTKRGKTLNYTQEKLEKAVASVQDGSLSVRKAASMYNVPKSTIADRLTGKHPLEAKRGRPPHIPFELESKVVDAVKMAARRGIGLTRKQVLARTNTLCQRTKIAGGYQNFVAGKDWWEGVKRRHPDVALRKPEKLSSVRARMMNREVINKYFHDLATLMEELKVESKPWAIWNCDELGKNFEHSPARVIAEKGHSCVSRTSSRSTNITVLACVNVSGRSMPPMFVVKGKTSRSLHGFRTCDAPPESRWFYQQNGWMDDAIGESWFSEVFLKYCGPERPQLLILDGHASHESLGLLMKAMEENVHILALPPHTTHFLQPLDRSVFGPLNRAYNEECSVFLRESPLHQISKWTFSNLFRKAWDRAMICSNIMSGFRACGIYPLNRDAIPESAFGPSEPTNVSPVNASNPFLSEASISDTTEHQELEALLPISSENEVLDISDPAQLLGLLSSGSFEVHQLIDEDGEIASIPTDGIQAMIPSSSLNAEAEINLLFLESADKPVRSSKKKKSVTSHRLLTSSEVMAEKIELSKKKERTWTKTAEKKNEKY